MDCRAFHELLDDLIEGRLAPDRHREARRHLRGCAACREIEGLARGAWQAPAVEPPADLAHSILARTSGAPCGRARELLCGHVDGALRRPDDELLRSHLGVCAECSALARALTQLARDLPPLCELEPGAGFVDEVLRATVPVPVRAVPGRPRWSEGWQHLLRRPRIAWEGAYVGAFLLALVLGAPGTPLAGVPERALELVRANPVEELKSPVTELEGRVASGVRSAWDATGRKVFVASRRAATSTVERIKSDLGTLWERLASEEENDTEKDPAVETSPTEGDRS